MDRQRTEKLRVTRHRLARAGFLTPVEVDLAKDDRTLVVTLTIDDPAVETEAMVGAYVEANGKGESWSVVATLWAGGSGVMTSYVPIEGRRLRVKAAAERTAVIDLDIATEG